MPWAISVTAAPKYRFFSVAEIDRLVGRQPAPNAQKSPSPALGADITETLVDVEQRGSVRRFQTIADSSSKHEDTEGLIDVRPAGRRIHLLVLYPTTTTVSMFLVQEQSGQCCSGRSLLFRRSGYESGQVAQIATVTLFS